MTAPRPGTDAGSPARYEIRVDSVLDPAWFDGLDVRDDGQHTIISACSPTSQRCTGCSPRSETSGCA